MDIKKTIKEFVNNELIDNGFRGNISDNESLIDSDILDSLSILQLISFLDEKFGIIPNEDEIYPQNFDSINLIHMFVEKKISQKKNSR